jgi:hypothetical protein
MIPATTTESIKPTWIENCSADIDSAAMGQRKAIEKLLPGVLRAAEDWPRQPERFAYVRAVLETVSRSRAM